MKWIASIVVPQAEPWRRKWLAVVKERSGADSLPYAGELSALGLNLLHQKKWVAAEVVLREADHCKDRFLATLAHELRNPVAPIRTGLEVLRLFCEALDRLRDAQRRIQQDGPTYSDRFGQLKAHPLLAVERDARSQMLQALRALNLTVEPLRDGPGRPGGGR